MTRLRSPAGPQRSDRFASARAVAGPQRSDRFASARAVADAVLYEGYILYPYRASSTKNQVRWQFGVLAPRSFSEVDPSEHWSMHTECLVEATSDSMAQIQFQVCCLQVQHRSVEAAVLGGLASDDTFAPVDTPASSDAAFAPVAALEVDGRQHVPWDEAVERVIDIGPLSLRDLVESREHEERFFLDGGRDVEDIPVPRAGAPEPAGRVVRVRHPIQGRVRIQAGHRDQGSLVRLDVDVENLTGFEGPWRREDALGASLVAAHLMLAVDGARFISLLDPPPHAEAAARDCRQRGGFPVLIGEDDVMLVSPIILYDHPEVAPESPGELCDSTEIDEILALRVLTLTEEEKAEARSTDVRAAAIIDRCDTMRPEVWERLHGTFRSIAPFDRAVPLDGAVPSEEVTAAPWWDPEADAAVDPWSDTVNIAGWAVGKGSAVRLHPTHRADAQDTFLEGLDATVAGVFTDVDGQTQVAVTVDDDPATSELAWQGRYLFFYPDEVEPLATGSMAP